MANDLLLGFSRNCSEYSDHVFIIRTAPGIEELEDIAPTRVVMRLKRYVQRPCGYGVRERLRNVMQWCEDSGVPMILMRKAI